MNASARRVLFWTPRILCILFAVFLSVFSLDVFSEGYGFWQTIGALLLHLVPTFIVVFALLIGWRWEWVGQATRHNFPYSLKISKQEAEIYYECICRSPNFLFYSANEVEDES